MARPDDEASLRRRPPLVVLPGKPRVSARDAGPCRRRPRKCPTTVKADAPGILARWQASDRVLWWRSWL